MNRRTPYHRASAFVLMTASLAIFPMLTGASPQQTTPAAAIPSAKPMVTGPIKNTTPLKDPAHGYPFSATSVDLKKAGYVEEEYFLEGNASRYLTSATANATVVDSNNPYKTRLVVRRPTSPSKFNGTVIVEWTNVSQGHDNEVDWFQTNDHLIAAGYAWVGVSAQAVGVNALTQWSPSRYGTLNVNGPAAPAGGGRGAGAPAGPGGPRAAGSSSSGLREIAFVQGAPGGRGGAGGAQRGGPGGAAGGPPAGGPRGGGGPSALAYDIFGQAGMAIRGKANMSVLGDLKAQRVIATGHSQSAGQLATYFNSVHPLAPVYDAVMLRGGGGVMRTDLNVKIFKLESESDNAEWGASYRPDSDKLRTWEVAGVSHLDAQASIGLGREGLLVAGATPVEGKDVVKPPTISNAGDGKGIGGYQTLSTQPNDGCNKPTLTRVPFHYVQAIAYDYMVEWIKSGKAPPSAPQFEIEGNAIKRNKDGNALGGIQLSQHAVPTAVNRGDNSNSGQAGFCNLIGSYEPFDAAKLAMLYPSHDAYVKAVKEVTEKNLKAGYILKADADATIAEANKSSIGKK